MLPGQPPTTPRGSLNLQNARLNLTGYRNESQRLNFPNSSLIHSILDSAIYWTQIDDNQETRREIESLLVLDNFKELTKRFATRVKFLTKEGVVIRSKVGAGFSRVNPITLQYFAHGVLDFILNYQPRQIMDQNASELFLRSDSLKGHYEQIRAEISPQIPPSHYQEKQKNMIHDLLSNKGIVLGYDQKSRSCTVAKILAAVLKKYGGA